MVTCTAVVSYPPAGSARPHAVTAAGPYSYDAESRLRSINDGTQVLGLCYDAEGRLVKPVQSTPSTTWVFLGPHYEQNVTSGVAVRSYYAGSRRVAVRRGGVLSYLPTDRLGSATLSTTSAGDLVGQSQSLYRPYGEPVAGYAGAGTLSARHPPTAASPASARCNGRMAPRRGSATTALQPPSAHVPIPPKAKRKPGKQRNQKSPRHKRPPPPRSKRPAPQCGV